MIKASITLIPFILACAAGCAQKSESTQHNQGDEAAEVSASLAEPLVAAPGCQAFEAVGRPVAVAHLHDPNLRQTAGVVALRAGKAGWHEARLGTTLATLVGQNPDGTQLGNHHWLFGDGVLRTQNDTIQLVPTKDPCLFDVRADIFIVDGTGAFQGAKGTAKAKGQINFCGAPGLVYLWGQTCAAPAGG